MNANKIQFHIYFLPLVYYMKTFYCTIFQFLTHFGRWLGRGWMGYNRHSSPLSSRKLILDGFSFPFKWIGYYIYVPYKISRWYFYNNIMVLHTKKIYPTNNGPSLVDPSNETKTLLQNKCWEFSFLSIYFLFLIKFHNYNLISFKEKMTFFCAISAKKYWISLYSGKIDRQIELDAGVSGEEEREEWST